MSDRYLTDQVIDFLYRERVVDPGEATEHRSLADFKKWVQAYTLESPKMRHIIFSYARGAITPGFFEALDLEGLKRKQARLVSKR